MSDSEYKDPEWDNSLELKKALKLVLKYEIHCLLRRLSETGEESVVITASAAEGSASHLCSKKGEDFLQIESLDVVKHNFLSYCKVASEPSFNKKSSLENFMSQSQTAPKEQYEVSPKEQSSEEITIIEPVSIKSEPIDIDLDLDLQASELTECPQPQEQKTVGRESSQAHRGRKKESSCMPFLREDSKGHFTSDVPEIGERLFENVQYCVYKNHTGKKFDSDFKICSGTIESTRLEVLSLVNDQSQETIPNSLTDARASDGHFASSLTGPVKTYGRPIHDAVDEVDCHYLSAIRGEEFESKGQSASDKPDALCTDVMMDGLTAHSMNPIHVAPESSADSGQSVVRDHGFRISFPVEGNSNTSQWRPSVSLGTERNHRPKSFRSYRQTEDTQSAYKYMCQICGKGSNTRFAHHRHLQCHTGQRPYVCTICGRGLSDKRSYSDHIQMHSGIRPYRCDVCHKSFKHYTTFNTHMRKIHKLRSKS